jgi:hypothetical protein
MRSTSTVLLAAAVFLLNVWLFWPLFLPGESPYRDTIESGYMGMSRFLANDPSAWGWNPLQYCGQPTQFMYVPALHYGAAAVSWTTGVPAADAYKLITATMACLGPVAMFALVFTLTRSRGWALTAALAYTFFSPLYGLIRQLDRDRGIVYLPWRMHVFAKYGEGPHTAGLTLIAFSLALAWKTATAEWRRAWHVPALAALFALVCLTNWIAALALALCMMLFLLAAAGLPGFRRRRLIAAALLAYGLACWWLTPTFIRTIAFNWPADAFNYKLQVTQGWLLAGWAAGIVLLRLTARLLEWEFAPTFLWLGVWTFGFPVVIFYSYNIDTLPESRRYAVEFTLFFFAALIEFLRWATISGNRVRQFCAAAVAVAFLATGLTQAKQLLTQPYDRWRPVPAPSTREYRIASWIAEQRPQGRVLASGGLRFRLNSWFDIHQVGGAFESGLRNRVPVHFAYQIRTGIGSRLDNEAQEALLQMKALGVEYVVVHGPESEEYYRDYRNPMKFEGVLEKPWAQGNDWIYRVPFTSLAHLVRPDEQPLYGHREWIAKYVGAIDDPNRPKLRARWLDARTVEVTGPVAPGHDVVVAVTHEDGWQVAQDGTPVELTANTMNFLVAKARPSAASVLRFEYRGTPEQRGMGVLSAVVWAGTIRYLWKRRGQSPP